LFVSQYKWNGGDLFWFPPLEPTGNADPPYYFCQVRFLWRLARSFLRRLCLLIFAFRRFFNEPINSFYCSMVLERICEFPLSHHHRFRCD